MGVVIEICNKDPGGALESGGLISHFASQETAVIVYEYLRLQQAP
jgi:hypothetical protein